MRNLGWDSNLFLLSLLSHIPLSRQPTRSSSLVHPLSHYTKATTSHTISLLSSNTIEIIGFCSFLPSSTGNHLSPPLLILLSLHLSLLLRCQSTLLHLATLPCQYQLVSTSFNVRLPKSFGVNARLERNVSRVSSGTSWHLKAYQKVLWIE